jgi:3-(3-hydroxy-phenyl)propionate hydroxylase
MTEHAVLIAGAGPTGLMLAGELAVAGVNVAAIPRGEPGGLGIAPWADRVQLIDAR